jgi:hypothetical protein
MPCPAGDCCNELRDWTQKVDQHISFHAPAATEPCTVCRRPLPPLSQWSMPACPTCTEAVETAAASLPPVPARNDADYALEHAGYLATAAERFIASVDQFDRAADAFEDDADDETRDDLKQAVDTAFEARCDHRNGLANAIYEFRKRAERATSTKGEAP